MLEAVIFKSGLLGVTLCTYLLFQHETWNATPWRKTLISSHWYFIWYHEKDNNMTCIVLIYVLCLITYICRLCFIWDGLNLKREETALPKTFYSLTDMHRSLLELESQPAIGLEFVWRNLHAFAWHVLDQLQELLFAESAALIVKLHGVLFHFSSDLKMCNICLIISIKKRSPCLWVSSIDYSVYVLKPKESL